MKSTLKKSLVATVASALLAGGAWQAYAKEGQATTEPTLAIPLIQALEIAQASVPGEVRGAELDTEAGQSFWEIDILADNGESVELGIDASDGTIISRQAEEADDDQDDD